MSSISPTDGDSISGAFDVSVSKYAAMYSVTTTDASKDVRAALGKLLARTITIYLPDEGTEDEDAYDAYSVLMKVAKRPKRGIYQLEINPFLLPFFTGLKREFTKLRLLDVADLRNPHAMRLYENLIQFEGTKVFCQRVEWFVERYQLPKSYSHYGLFKQKFLDVAVAEINAKTPISVSYVENKTGRKVTSILFSFSRKTEVSQ